MWPLLLVDAPREAIDEGDWLSIIASSLTIIAYAGPAESIMGCRAISAETRDETRMDAHADPRDGVGSAIAGVSEVRTWSRRPPSARWEAASHWGLTTALGCLSWCSDRGEKT